MRFTLLVLAYVAFVFFGMYGMSHHFSDDVIIIWLVAGIVIGCGADYHYNEEHRS